MYESMLRCFSFSFALGNHLGRTSFTNEGVVNVNALLSVAAALVTLMDHDSVNQVVEHPRGKFIKSCVLFGCFQKTSNIDGLAVYLYKLILNGLNFATKDVLLLLIIRREDFEPFIR